MSIATRIVRASRMPKYAPGSSTVLWMPGQDDPRSATIRDRSGNGLDGTMVGSSWKRTTGGLWHLSFDGIDDVVTTSDDALFDVGGNLTFKVWFRTSAALAGVAIGIHDLSSYKWLLFIATNSTRLLGYTRHAVGGVSEIDFRDNDFTDNIWRMATMTFDKSLGSNRHKVYINATIGVQGNAFNEDIQAGDEGLVLGRYGGNYFEGDIALPLVLSRTWSTSEITYWYNQERYLFGV